MTKGRRTKIVPDKTGVVPYVASWMEVITSPVGQVKCTCVPAAAVAQSCVDARATDAKMTSSAKS